MEEALLLAQDGERENANEKLSSNIVVVVFLGSDPNGVVERESPGVRAR